MSTTGESCCPSTGRISCPRTTCPRHSLRRFARDHALGRSRDEAGVSSVSRRRCLVALPCSLDRPASCAVWRYGATVGHRREREMVVPMSAGDVGLALTRGVDTRRRNPFRCLVPWDLTGRWVAARVDPDRVRVWVERAWVPNMWRVVWDARVEAHGEASTLRIRWRAAKSFVLTNLAIILVITGIMLRPMGAGLQAALQDLVANAGWLAAINLLFLSVPWGAYLAYRPSDKRYIEAFVQERLVEMREGSSSSTEGDGP